MKKMLTLLHFTSKKRGAEGEELSPGFLVRGRRKTEMQAGWCPETTPLTGSPAFLSGRLVTGEGEEGWSRLKALHT